MDEKYYPYLYAAGGAVAGMLGYSLISGSPDHLPESHYTGISRFYRSGKKEDPGAYVSLWVDPIGKYFAEFEIAHKGGYEALFPEMDGQVFPAAMTAAMWADDLMHRMGYTPESEWADTINASAKMREKERPAISGRRRRR